MSYILDALKRAESERSRGEVPSIHAPSVPIGAAEGERVMSAPLRWAVVALLLAVLAAALWWWSADKPVAREELAMERPQPQPPSPALPQVTVPSVEVRMSRESAAAAPAPPLPPLVARPVSPEAVTKPPSRLDVGRPAPQAVDRAPKPASPASAPSNKERVYAIKELPQDVRVALPAVTVGGASYSESPTSRMLIINGQIYHEGDKLTPELSLQQIHLRSAVLSFRGYRYAITY
jgi:general secretion pathway protein B